VVIDGDPPLSTASPEISRSEDSLSSALSHTSQLVEEVAALKAHAGHREQQFAQQLLDCVGPVNLERAALLSNLLRFAIWLLRRRRCIATTSWMRCRRATTPTARVRGAVDEAETLHRQVLAEMQASHDTELARVRGAVDEAETLHRQVLAEMQASHDTELARVRGAVDEAGTLHRQALRKCSGTMSPNLRRCGARRARQKRCTATGWMTFAEATNPNLPRPARTWRKWMQRIAANLTICNATMKRSAEQEAERAFLALELSNANDIYRHVENKHSKLADMFSDVVAERDALYHDLTLKGGPRALRLALRLRSFRVLGQSGNRLVRLNHVSGPVGEGEGRCAGCCMCCDRCTVCGIARDSCSCCPSGCATSRKQTRSLWMDLRARAPAELLHPPSVEMPTPGRCRPRLANWGGRK